MHSYLTQNPSKVSSSTSNFIIGMTALAGSTVFIASGLIAVTLAAPMAVGTTVGSLIGSRILPKMKDKTIRVLFLIILVYLIIQMLYKGVTSL
ncbi:MAG: sulfite exporter TauE/SafE family protein [Thermoprotei archaeon]